MASFSRASCILLAAACSIAAPDGNGGASGGAPTTGAVGPGTGVDDGGDSGEGGTVGTDASTDGSGGIKLDVGAGDIGGGSLCGVDPQDGDAPGPCEDRAPADSFDPVIQWEFTGVDGLRNSATTPLVANLTDDNGDGMIDLCDVPDVVVLLWENWIPTPQPSYLFVLDGEDGSVHWSSDIALDDMNPALGDIDGDGKVEIVAQQFEGSPIAFEHDGTVKWQGSGRVHPRFNAIAIADLEGDGTVELVYPAAWVLDADGNELVPPSTTSFWEASAPVVVDLDDDGSMEILDGEAVYHHDGSPYWDPTSLVGCPLLNGAALMPGVADFDDDGDPEVFYSGRTSPMFCIVEADGTVSMTQADLPGTEATDWFRPPAVHDVDGDGAPDVAVGGTSAMSGVPGYFAVLSVEADGLTPLFVKDDVDEHGNAGATAFDFLGDATAEAIYMDHTRLFAYDSRGTPEFVVQRSSYTQIEYPVVADVDNDGSAEFIVTSNGGQAAVRVFRDAEDRWIPARRIWNQHTYHVTNVREDGTIPSPEPKHWLGLNTFRTQAQIVPGGGTCRPEG